MFSTMKRLSAFCVIIGFINLVCMLGFFSWLCTLELDFGFLFTSAIFVLTIPVLLLLMAFGMRSLSTDLQMQHDALEEKLTQHKKRMDYIEKYENIPPM